MTTRPRLEFVCDWCDKRMLAPLIKRGLEWVPPGWVTVQWDVYGNCTHYCCVSCEKAGRQDVENAMEGDGEGGEK